jgi:uroporphyrinogen III methyltransferase/synthase
MTDSPSRPLAGRTVLITRARSQASSLSEQLETLGARVLAVPTIEFADPPDWAPLDRAIEELPSFDWVIFTSVNGVVRFFRRFDDRCGGRPFPAGIRLAAIGPATASALDARGLAPEVVPKVFRAEDLAAALPMAELRGKRVLIARAETAREVLPETLAASGAEVVVAPCYRTVRPDVNVEEVTRAITDGRVDVVTFTSSSTVSNFVDLFPEGEAARRLRSVAVACIGPITAETAKSLGITPAATAEEYTIPGLVDTIVRLLSGPANPRRR